MAVEVVPKIDFDTYQEQSAYTRSNDLPFPEALSNAALGLAGEVGETCGMLKKVLFHGHSFYPEKLKLELGDVLFYLTWLASLHDLTLEEIARANVEKLRARYPDGFSSERSLNREGVK